MAFVSRPSIWMLRSDVTLKARLNVPGNRPGPTPLTYRRLRHAEYLRKGLLRPRPPDRLDNQISVCQGTLGWISIIGNYSLTYI